MIWEISEMAAKKKKKFTKENWERMKAEVRSRTDIMVKDHKKMAYESKRTPEKLSGTPIGYDPFSHPHPNSADWDMIYMKRGKK